MARSALITGGTGGLGAAVTRAFLDAGWRVVVPLYDEATPDELREMGELTQTAMRVLRTVSHCDGFNIGMNQGEVAGAGIAAHLHQHIVPRWQSDANFFPIIARTKSMSQMLGDTRRLVAEGWPAAD